MAETWQAAITATAKVRPLYDESIRYVGLAGGRGSSKSWTVADWIVAHCQQYLGTRGLLVREIQKSLMQSAKHLIESRLEHHKLGTRQGWRILNESIVTPGGGLLIFQGMQNHTADSIKSFEGFDFAWVEEAHTLSQFSLDLLRPTIRKAGSRIICTWNPRHNTDPVDVMFRGPEPPSSSVFIPINYDDNPWFPAELEAERMDCLRSQPDQYGHIWLGEYVSVATGAYFRDELRQCKDDGRIMPLAPNTLMTYHVFCDIGGLGAKSDNFAMWVAQFVGEEIRVLDWYEAQGQDLGAHLAWLRSKGYTEARTRIVLPHDGAPDKGPYRLSSWESGFIDAGYTNCEVVHNQGSGAAMARVQAVRRLFPRIKFNEDRTEGGRRALGWYHPKIHEQLGTDLGPEHDWSSHSSDAFGLMAVAYEEPRESSTGSWSKPRGYK